MTSLKSQTSSSIRRRLQIGALRPGCPIPSEEALASELGISRCVVRHALAELEREGLVVKLPGQGRIAAHPTNNSLLTDAVVILGASPRGSHVPLPGFHAAVDWGASNRLLERGEMVLSFDLNHHADERVRRLIVARPRGIIVGQELDAAPNAQELVRTLASSVTTLALGSDALPELVCDRVVDDQDSGGYALTRHLLTRGRRRIVLLAPESDQPWFKHRLAGYRRAMAEAGLVAREPVMVRFGIGRNERDSQVLDDRAKGCAGFLLSHVRQAEPIDALIALTDGDCFPVMLALAALGLEPGRDIDVAGYDDYWREAGEQQWCPYRPCATVAKDNPGIGRRLADTLLERLGGAFEAPSVRLLHAPRVVPTI